MFLTINGNLTVDGFVTFCDAGANAAVTPWVLATFTDSQVALADAVASAVAAGQIDPSVAPDLENRAGELAAAFTTGAPDAAHRADDFSHRLSELANHGQITQAGYATIAATLQQLTGAGTGPADSGDGGD